MDILLLIEIIGAAALFFLSKSKFKEEISVLKAAKDKNRLLIPIGLMLLKLFNHRYLTGYEKRLEIKLRSLNPDKDPHECLKYHIAKKTGLLIFAVVFLTFIGTQIEKDLSYVFFCTILLFCIFYFTDRQVDNNLKLRQRDMQIEFTEFINKLVLLVNAGMTIPGSIQKIVRDNKKKSPLYVELAMALNDMDSGKTDIEAYEDFALRCRLHDVTTFVSILLQNIRKGNSEIIPILKVQADASWEMRKNNAKKLGEEASTKLLIPLVIIFLAILIMVITPAVMQLKI